MRRFLLLLITSGSLFSAEWRDVPSGRSFLLQVPSGGKSGFTSVAGEVGITFTNIVTRERYTTNQVYLNGAGVAAGDVDSDGNTDVYFANLSGSNALYKNLGNWRFADVTTEAGVGFSNLSSTGVALADLDGDDDLDLLLNTIGQGTHLLLNNGSGRFTPAGVFNSGKAGMSMAIADTDGDGDLDLYITNYRTTTIRDDPNAQIAGEYVKGRPVPSKYNGRSVNEPDLQGRFVFGPTGRIIENGELDLFLRNDGQGKFTSVPLTEILFESDGKPLQTLPFDWGLSCMFHDMNGDRAPDLYVCNDFDSPDRIWLNDGAGKFRAAPWQQIRHTSMFSMGVDFGDINRDGHADFFVADMLSRSHLLRQTQTGEVPPYTYTPGDHQNRPSYSHNTLFLNRGNNTFAEIAYYSGVQASEWSWTPAFLDVDLDGYEDLLVTTGHELEMMNGDAIEAADRAKNQKQMSRLELLSLRHLFKRFAPPNVAFRNRGNLTFEDVSAAWGFDQPSVSHGMALADFDNDGDVDLAVNNLNSAASLYRNNSSSPRLNVRLRGSGQNKSGVGAVIKVTGGKVSQSAEIISGGRYLSSDQPMRTFAADAESSQVEVTWRSGRRSVIRDVPPNSLIEIAEESAVSFSQAATNNPAPIFTSIPLPHTHFDEAFDDFQRQLLLPMKLSHLGPGASWHDFDGDGWEDLFIGAGRGGKFTLLRNSAGVLSNSVEQVLQRPMARDQTTILALASALIPGSSNYEDGQTNGGWTRIYDLARKASGENVLRPESSVGPMSMADIDGDGNLDIFVGGRAISGKYPLPAMSVVLRNDGERFSIHQRLEKLGLISGATFTDLDNDGDPDLLLASHWGPIRALRNDRGQFTDATADYGLAEMKGLWNGIAMGDFNNDGQLDFIASNWGLNSRWQPAPERPVKLYYGDFDENSALDLLETQFEPSLKKEVTIKGHRLLTMALPNLKEKFPTRELFGQASIEELVPAIQSHAYHSIAELRTSVFLRSGARFAAQPLPPEAQFTPAFGIAIADFNGDGNLDTVLAQNFFATSLDTPRSDAGSGLLLWGDGKGGFSAATPAQSGLAAHGEGRAAAICDFDHDGAADLVITQNSGPTLLYKNTTGPALRVRLKGPATNPTGIGVKVRSSSGGPIYEVHAGEGYWSLNGPVIILPAHTREVETTLPGGRSLRTVVPPSTREILVDLPPR